MPNGSRSLRGHLADFETTTSGLLRDSEALALLNFAALFHETIYIADTAIGDHELIISSFHKYGHLGLYGQIRRLGEEGILRVLYRDKVIVRGKELAAGKLVPISKIFEGWKYRDTVEWGGVTGFTTVIPEDLRAAYYRDVENWLSRCDIVTPYNPDIPKSAFREAIRTQLNSSVPSTLLRTVATLPQTIKDKYFETIEDPWFTNAELWRHLRDVSDLPAGREAIILQAHINQQCYADLTGSGQSTHDKSQQSLASFNLELKRQHLFIPEAEATLSPPESLSELLKLAPVQLYSYGLEMFEKLSVEDIVAIRRKGGRLFELAKRTVETHDELQSLTKDYLEGIQRYWSCVVDEFERVHPRKMLRPTAAGIFVEANLEKLASHYKNYGADFISVILRFALPKLTIPVSLLLKGLNHIGVVYLQEQTPENVRLRSWLPPSQWRSHGSNRLLSLEGS